MKIISYRKRNAPDLTFFKSMTIVSIKNVCKMYKHSKSMIARKIESAYKS